MQVVNVGLGVYFGFDTILRRAKIEVDVFKTVADVVLIVTVETFHQIGFHCVDRIACGEIVECLCRERFAVVHLQETGKVVIAKADRCAGESL